MTPENMLESHSYTGPGFKPLVFFESWRVAVLNYLDEIHPAKVDRLERHPQTDEVFVLTSGSGLLFLAAGGLAVTELHLQVMQPGVIYNVKSLTWHTIVLSRDASVLIVENADTGPHNSEFTQLSPQLRQFIQRSAQQHQPNEW